MFEERDVSHNKTAMKELEERNLMTTPVTLIDGQTVVGYDKAALARLLGIAV